MDIYLGRKDIFKLRNNLPTWQMLSGNLRAVLGFYFEFIIGSLS